MPSLKDIRRRITSVKKTQQITRAMRMVAAAKLRRAQEAIESARPYADRMRETLGEVAAGGAAAAQPLLAVREHVRRVDFVVVASDRGLCGAFNASVLRRAEAEIEAREPGLDRACVIAVGRKTVEHFRRRRGHALVHAVSGMARIDYSHAVEIASYVAGRFLSGEADEVVLVHSEFISTLTQRPRAARLLPLVSEQPDDTGKPPYEVEPSPEKLLEVLVPKALQTEIYRALLDSQAGEYAARMTAMESATRNTQEMIESLTLKYNRVRQAAITKELVEIVSGAEAL